MRTQVTKAMATEIWYLLHVRCLLVAHAVRSLVYNTTIPADEHAAASDKVAEEKGNIDSNSIIITTYNSEMEARSSQYFTKVF